MAYEWQLFWVGDGGNPAGGRPVPGWEDLEERERALGLRERQPILISPDGRIDPRLSECLRRSAFSAKAQGTQVTYAPLYRLFFTFLWQRGLDWDEASEDDVEDWAAIDLLPEAVAGVYRLLIRRNRTTGELAYYRCLSPHPVPIGTLVRVAGMRWRIEETFQAGKGLAGLDEHQVRCYTPWLRWVTLAMLAHAFLAVVRAREHRDHPVPDGLIALTCNEIQRLFATPTTPPDNQREHRLHWSLWRRRHQARARTCRYRHRTTTP